MPVIPEPQPWRAHVRLNPMLDAIDVAVLRRSVEGTHYINWADGPGLGFIPHAERDPKEPEPSGLWGSIREDAAMALYQALAQHYGHMPGDSRLLRQDYDAERHRVDGLIASLSKIAERP